MPTFGLETILQVPLTTVVGPGVGVINGAGVEVGVWTGLEVGVGVFVFLAEGPACAGCAPVNTSTPMSMPLRSRMPSRLGNLLK